MNLLKKTFLLLIPLNILTSPYCTAECIQTCINNDLERFQTYFHFIDTYPHILGPKGNHFLGEIELVEDIPTIQSIEKASYQKAIQKGFCEEEARKASQAGIIVNDLYFLYIRDPVKFPSNTTGLYNRLIWKHSLHAPAVGAAVLPITFDGKIILEVIYRHALRSWEVELPGALVEPDESPEQTLKRALDEETGFQVIGPLYYLGEVTTDHAVMAVSVPIYLAKVSKNSERHLEATKALADHLTLSKEELKNALIQGYINATFNGHPIKARVRDSQLTYAVLLAELKHLF